MRGRAVCNLHMAALSAACLLVCACSRQGFDVPAVQPAVVPAGAVQGFLEQDILPDAFFCPLSSFHEEPMTQIVMSDEAHVYVSYPDDGEATGSVLFTVTAGDSVSLLACHEEWIADEARGCQRASLWYHIRCASGSGWISARHLSYRWAKGDIDCDGEDEYIACQRYTSRSYALFADDEGRPAILDEGRQWYGTPVLIDGKDSSATPLCVPCSAVDCNTRVGGGETNDDWWEFGAYMDGADVSDTDTDLSFFIIDDAGFNPAVGFLLVRWAWVAEGRSGSTNRLYYYNHDVAHGHAGFYRLHQYRCQTGVSVIVQLPAYAFDAAGAELRRIEGMHSATGDADLCLIYRWAQGGADSVAEEGTPDDGLLFYTWDGTCFRVRPWPFRMDQEQEQPARYPLGWPRYCVVDENAWLCARPDSGAEERIRLIKPGESLVVLQDVSAQWHRVACATEEGYMEARHLSTLWAQGDIDGDGAEEWLACTGAGACVLIEEDGTIQFHPEISFADEDRDALSLSIIDTRNCEPHLNLFAVHRVQSDAIHTRLFRYDGETARIVHLCDFSEYGWGN